MPMLVYPHCNHFFGEMHTANKLGILDFTRSGGCVLRYTLHFHDQSRGKKVIIYNRLCMKTYCSARRKRPVEVEGYEILKCFVNSAFTDDAWWVRVDFHGDHISVEVES